MSLSAHGQSLLTLDCDPLRLIQNDGYGFDALSPELFPHVCAWFDKVASRNAFRENVLPYHK